MEIATMQCLVGNTQDMMHAITATNTGDCSGAPYTSHFQRSIFLSNNEHVVILTRSLPISLNVVNVGQPLQL